MFGGGATRHHTNSRPPLMIHVAGSVQPRGRFSRNCALRRTPSKPNAVESLPLPPPATVSVAFLGRHQCIAGGTPEEPRRIPHVDRVTYCSLGTCAVKTRAWQGVSPPQKLPCARHHELSKQLPLPLRCGKLIGHVSCQNVQMVIAPGAGRGFAPGLGVCHLTGLPPSDFRQLPRRQEV